jgi:hypothetical protein
MAITWTEPTNVSAKGVADSGTEAAPVALTDGLELSDILGFAIHAESGSAFAGGTLDAYLLNEVTGNWNRSPDLDLIVDAALSAQGFSGFGVSSPTSRIAYVPNGIAAGLTIYINGSFRRRNS